MTTVFVEQNLALPGSANKYDDVDDDNEDEDDDANMVKIKKRTIIKKKMEIKMLMHEKSNIDMIYLLFLTIFFLFLNMTGLVLNRASKVCSSFFLLCLQVAGLQELAKVLGCRV